MGPALTLPHDPSLRTLAFFPASSSDKEREGAKWLECKERREADILFIRIIRTKKGKRKIKPRLFRLRFERPSIRWRRWGNRPPLLQIIPLPSET